MRTEQKIAPGVKDVLAETEEREYRTFFESVLRSATTEKSRDASRNACSALAKLVEFARERPERGYVSSGLLRAVETASRIRGSRNPGPSTDPKTREFLRKLSGDMFATGLTAAGKEKFFSETADTRLPVYIGTAANETFAILSSSSISRGALFSAGYSLIAYANRTREKAENKSVLLRISRKLEELFSSGSDPSVYGPFLSFNFVKCAASVLSSDVGFVEEAVLPPARGAIRSFPRTLTSASRSSPRYERDAYDILDKATGKKGFGKLRVFDADFLDFVASGENFPVKNRFLFCAAYLRIPGTKISAAAAVRIAEDMEKNSRNGFDKILGWVSEDISVLFDFLELLTDVGGAPKIALNPSRTKRFLPGLETYVARRGVDEKLERFMRNAVFSESAKKTEEYRTLETIYSTEKSFQLQNEEPAI